MSKNNGPRDRFKRAREQGQADAVENRKGAASDTFYAAFSGDEKELIGNIGMILDLGLRPARLSDADGGTPGVARSREVINSATHSASYIKTLRAMGFEASAVATRRGAIISVQANQIADFFDSERVKQLFGKIATQASELKAEEIRLLTEDSRRTSPLSLTEQRRTFVVSDMRSENARWGAFVAAQPGQSTSTDRSV